MQNVLLTIESNVDVKTALRIVLNFLILRTKNNKKKKNEGRLYKNTDQWQNVLNTDREFRIFDGHHIVSCTKLYDISEKIAFYPPSSANIFQYFFALTRIGDGVWLTKYLMDVDCVYDKRSEECRDIQIYHKQDNLNSPMILNRDNSREVRGERIYIQTNSSTREK